MVFTLIAILGVMVRYYHHFVKYIYTKIKINAGEMAIKNLEIFYKLWNRL